MNFFAHCWIGRRVQREPRFLLGTMLPDFATMCRARLAEIDDEPLRAGVAEHHRTDQAFHSGATFVALCTDVAATLEARGLGWGAARAVAHVGTELLLDGELTEDLEAGRDYRAAVAEAAQSRAGARVAFRDAAGRARFEDLHRRLLEHGAPVRYREPVFVAEVLFRILAPRPRLAVPESHRSLVVAEMESLAGRVRIARDALLDETAAGLGAERDQASAR